MDSPMISVSVTGSKTATAGARRPACVRRLGECRLLCSAALAVLLLAGSSSILVDAGRTFPRTNEEDLTTAFFTQAPPRSDEWDITLPRTDLSKMSCPEANAYMAQFERQLRAPPKMMLDLERVCVSLRSAMIGMPRCPGFTPSGSFAKLFRVCKIATNNGLLTCPASSGTTCGSF